MEQKKKGSLRTALLVRCLIPILLMGVVIAFSAISMYGRFMEKEVRHSLEGIGQSVVATYDTMMPGLFSADDETGTHIYKGTTEITGNFDLIDAIANQCGAEISVIFGNTRVITTLNNSHGERYINTGVNETVVRQLSETKESYCHEVDIDGEKYYACYQPLFNGETYVGMVGAAKHVKDMKEERREVVVPIVLTTLASMLLASIIILSYTASVVGDVSEMKKFLRGMIGGELSNELPGRVLTRKDELGEMGKDLNDMQTAIRVLVERDPLTGLYNRRYGAARLRKMMTNKEKYGTSCAVCIGDIDFFKKVNDTYGHDAGDLVLKNVASTMNKYMTGKGFVARWGGEEFLLAFTKVGQDDAAKYLEELLEKIRQIELLYEGKTIRVTMTFGVADGSLHAEYGPLLNEADARLYYGKQSGRNQVVSTASEILKAMLEEKKAAEEKAKSEQNPENKTESVLAVEAAEKRVAASVSDEPLLDDLPEQKELTNTTMMPSQKEIESLISSETLAGNLARDHQVDRSGKNQSELIAQIIQRIGDALLNEITEDEE